MQELVEILQGMAHDIADLQSWRDAHDQRIKKEQEEQNDTMKMFNEYITERRKKETKEQSDLQKLREMMM